GGTATAAVTVTVDLSASVGIHMLKAQVRHSRLSSEPKLRLLATLHESEIALSRGRLHHAANEMKVFVAEVRALRHAHQLAPRLAALWVFEASNVIAEIG
ncbi:MAG TPA: hypothetical protein VLM40_16180, partial [Gemmata sp.]|nr:hypothetical protein [Gemmata sp.]